MEEQELTEQQMMERCGAKMSPEKAMHVLDLFKENAEKRFPVDGTPAVGEDVNGYWIHGYLGTGGFGTVCLASKNDLYFAMKFMNVPLKQRGPDKEFKILQELLTDPSHQEFITAIEWDNWKDLQDQDGQEDLKAAKKKLCYMVFKLAGPSLQMLLEQQFQEKKCFFSIKDGVPIMRNALKALQLFHEKEHVHHDIKLDNFATDLFNENRIFLLDYGMGARPPRQIKKRNGFQGTRLYASRRALEKKTLSYRDDYESWLYCLYRFLCGGLLKERVVDPLEQKRKFWSPGTVQNHHILRIMKHIDQLAFREMMDFKFVNDCLQDLINEEEKIPYVPYLYKNSQRSGLKIVSGNFTFNAKEQEKKKPRIPFVCSRPKCNFAVYVEAAEYEKAQEDDIAIIIDSRNMHTCSTI